MTRATARSSAAAPQKLSIIFLFMTRTSTGRAGSPWPMRQPAGGRAPLRGLPETAQRKKGLPHAVEISQRFEIWARHPMDGDVTACEDFLKARQGR